MEEKELIELLKMKDENSFKFLINKYQKLVINACYKFVQNRNDAEDIAQDVFIEVLFSIKSFKSESKLSTWLYRIAVNKSLDFIKMKNRKKRFAFLNPFLNVDNEEVIQIESNETPQTILEQKENKKLILEAISRLPENQKAAIILAKMEGLSYLEIAEILKTSTSAVDSLIQRAKQNLKKYLPTEDY